MNTAHDYAETLLHMNETNPNNFSFDNFVGLLKQKKQYKMLPTILEQVQKIQSQSESDKTILVVQNKSVVADIQTHLDQYREQFGTEYEIVVDSNIVGGFVLKNKTNMVDQSYRKKLIQMYKNLVA